MSLCPFSFVFWPGISCLYVPRILEQNGFQKAVCFSTTRLVRSRLPNCALKWHWRLPRWLDWGLNSRCWTGYLLVALRTFYPSVVVSKRQVEYHYLFMSRIPTKHAMPAILNSHLRCVVGTNKMNFSRIFTISMSLHFYLRIIGSFSNFSKDPD